MAGDGENLGCLLVAGLLVWGGYTGWNNFETWRRPTNSCPPSTPGYPLWGASGISWGPGKAPPVQATIASVAAECIPPDAPGEKTASHGYSVAITATVNYKGSNDWFNGLIPDQTVIFECRTKNQVVLGSQESTIHFVRGGTDGTVSAKISGLTAEEVSRMGFVYARWKY